MRVPCVGAVISDSNGRIVMIRRGHPPSQGLWSIPGGRVEPGETLMQAAVREVWEETGLDVVLGEVIGRLEIPAGHDVYDVVDFAAVPHDKQAALVAGDDATDARWVTREELSELQTTPGLVDLLTEWDVWRGRSR